MGAVIRSALRALASSLRAGVTLAAGLRLAGATLVFSPALVCAAALHRAEAEDPRASEVTPLSEGVVLERQAAAGETHRYSLALRAGQYVQLHVKQAGPDVEQTLMAPGGDVLLKMDTNSEFETEPLAFIAGASGVYELRLKVLTVLPPARYEIRVEAVREPGPLDRLRVSAVQATSDALRLSTSQPAAAVERYREAVSAWRDLGDRRMEMWMEMGAARALKSTSRFEEANEVAEKALAIALSLEDEWAEAYIRLDLGISLRSLGRLDEGKEQFERALALHRAAGQEVQAAWDLQALGIFSSIAGEAQEGLDRLFEALRAFEAAADRRSEAAKTRYYIASAFLLLNDPEPALEHCRLALSALGAEDIGFRGACTGIMAEAHFQLGETARARELYSEALGLLQTVRMHPRVASRAHELLGDLLVGDGDLGGARREYAAALAATGDYAVRLGTRQCKLGEAELRLGNAAAARAAYEAALAVAPRAGAFVHQCAETGLGRLARDSGDLATARRHAERALAAAESLRSGLASDQTRSAVLAAQQSRYELMIDVLMRQHEREPSHGHDRAAFEMSERARARSLLELLTEGRVDVRRGVDPSLLAEERALRRRLNARAREEAAARDSGRTDRADALAREVEQLLTQLAETESRIRRLSPEYAALTQPQPLTLAEIREVLDHDTQLLQYALGEPRSYLWVASPTSLQSFTLAPRMEIERAARRVHELVSMPAARAGGKASTEVRAAAMRELGRLLLAPASAALTGKRLLVVAPRALQYVPFAALPLPEGMATDASDAPSGDPTGTLLSRFEIVSAPSVSVIATLRRFAPRRAPPERLVAVFADPVFEMSDPRVASALGKRLAPERQVASRTADTATPLPQALRSLRAIGGLGRLPFSRQEAEVISALAPADRTHIATGFDASREAAVSPRLGEYRLLHFATHGVLNERRPELSGVVLSLVDRAGRSQDGFLRLHDVYNLKLAADLVVLSGCQTALGKDVGGEGLVGLTRGFMYSGARGVVASLWQVDDESTAELMKHFYRAMLKDGRRPADALRAAQLELSRDRRWSAPFYWAAFVLQGDWR